MIGCALHPDNDSRETSPFKRADSAVGPLTYIDTHAHLWSVEYLDAIATLGAKDTAVARNIRATNSASDLKDRLQMMDDAGVKCQVLSATPQQPQWGDNRDAHQLAQSINDLYATLIKQYPGRFMAYGAVPLPHVDEAIKEARRAITKLNFQGIGLNTLVQNKYSLADPRFLPFFEELNRLKTVVYIHPTGCGANSRMINDYHLEWVIGAPMEDTIAVLQLLKADVPRRFPHIRFHVAHLGGVLPFLMQRIEDNYTDWNAFQSSPWETLRNFWFDTANFHKESLRCSRDTFGFAQLLLGSDFPYFQDDKYTRAVRYIQSSALDTYEQEAILITNAKRLYGL
ncbi:amidohydrolase family protein [Sphingobacterium psychroaquaticum]|uniref:Aminocarboxymuconate-semialdehyde decarboxylase n=1 Tax=Sphingobacterium psychroaquaticum TaxID=561061 RepID=A0A1X7JM22_9SPHI|nr:amidohydrolase family protein [Sphingobacterium psychroaquaticum]SMG29007.1 aminocarboxymuconate-semialdehyde decarboxylase [Sphingobacterium psychroaquaticum]